MSGKAWKQHERNVAHYFNTKRRSRGADFGQKDVEVIASVADWLGWGDTNTYIIAECKYSKYLGIVSTFRGIAAQDSCKDKVTILRLEEKGLTRPLYMCNLDDFDEIFTDFIYHQGAHNSLLAISEKYSIVSKTMSIPNYLQDFLEQARGYSTSMKSDNSNFIAFPIAVLAKARSVGRVTVFSSYDLENFWSQLDI